MTQTWSKTASLTATLMAALVGLAQAQEPPPSLGVTIDNTLASKYIWRGYNLFGSRMAYQPSVDVDLFGTGFSANVWGSIPLGTGTTPDSDGVNQWLELDYTVAYDTTLFAEELYALDLSVNYIYYHFPKLNTYSDAQEIGMGLALPNLIDIGGHAIVPSYYAGALWPTRSGLNDNTSGWWHIFALNYDLVTAAIVPGTEEQVWSFFWDIAYNDGAFAADHDWSHTTFGVSAPVEFPVNERVNLTVTPFLNFQISMDDSVNDKNELYGGLSVALSF